MKLRAGLRFTQTEIIPPFCIKLNRRIYPCIIEPTIFANDAPVNLAAVKVILSINQTQKEIIAYDADTGMIIKGAIGFNVIYGLPFICCNGFAGYTGDIGDYDTVVPIVNYYYCCSTVNTFASINTIPSRKAKPINYLVYEQNTHPCVAAYSLYRFMMKNADKKHVVLTVGRSGTGKSALYRAMRKMFFSNIRLQEDEDGKGIYVADEQPIYTITYDPSANTSRVSTEKPPTLRYLANGHDSSKAITVHTFRLSQDILVEPFEQANQLEHVFIDLPGSEDLTLMSMMAPLFEENYIVENTLYPEVEKLLSYEFKENTSFTNLVDSADEIIMVKYDQTAEAFARIYNFQLSNEIAMIRHSKWNKLLPGFDMDVPIRCPYDVSTFRSEARLAKPFYQSEPSDAIYLDGVSPCLTVNEPQKDLRGYGLSEGALEIIKPLVYSEWKRTYLQAYLFGEKICLAKGASQSMINFFKKKFLKVLTDITRNQTFRSASFIWKLESSEAFWIRNPDLPRDGQSWSSRFDYYYANEGNPLAMIKCMPGEKGSKTQ
jgi:hypothetical protein